MSVRLNEDKEIVAKIREGLKRKGGHCPCKLEVSPATKCICQEFREDGSRIQTWPAMNL